MDTNFWYGIIKEYYNLGLYTESDLDTFVQAKWITGEQKSEIVGNTNTATTSTANTDSGSNNATGAKTTVQ